MKAKDVAAFFIKRGIDEENEISNLKLQKLLYYAQGFHLAIFGSPLFDEAIYAWVNGPVVEEIYHEYKRYGKQPIDTFEYVSSLSEEDLEFLEEVWNVFGQFSAWKLRDMTHNEKTWMDHEADASEIPLEELKEYFETRVKK